MVGVTPGQHMSAPWRPAGLGFVESQQVTRDKPREDDALANPPQQRGASLLEIASNDTRHGEVFAVQRIVLWWHQNGSRPRPLRLGRWLCPHMPAGAAIEPLDRSHRLAAIEVFTTAASTELLWRR
jgi:hypothetical protein